MNLFDMIDKDAELGTQKAYRFWRYVFRHNGRSVRLLSWVSDMPWPPHFPVEGTTPDEGEQGIHGFKTEDDMIQSFHQVPDHLAAHLAGRRHHDCDDQNIRTRVTGCDGVVFGTIEMWGIIWDHAKGYRAQFARPLSFAAAYGNRSEQALAELRVTFFGRKT